MVAALALVLGYHGEGRGETWGRALRRVGRLRRPALIDLAKAAAGTPSRLDSKASSPRCRGSGRARASIADGRHFYQLVAEGPFATFAKDEKSARNLAILSQLLNTFRRSTLHRHHLREP